MKIKTSKRMIDVIGLFILTLTIIMFAFLIRGKNFNRIDQQGLDSQHPGPIRTTDREWREIFFKEKKVGYSVGSINAVNDGYFLQDEIFLRLNLTGFSSDVHTVTQANLDDKYLLRNFYFKMTSGVVSYVITGKVKGEELEIETPFRKKKEIQKIKLQKTPLIGAGLGFYFKGKRVKIGDYFSFPIFDPSTNAQQNARIRVTAREKININRKSYDVFRLETELWGKSMIFWIDDKGNTLKEEGLMGLTVVKSRPANAPLDLEHGEEIDFYDLASVDTNKKLANPERLSYLKIALDGFEKVKFDRDKINSGRQSLKDNILEIKKEAIPREASLSVSLINNNPALSSFLKPEFNIESDDPEIISKSREIIGSTKDPLIAARKIMGWVYHKLEKKPVVSVPNALEVLRSRVGDCNEHATLMTALLRASNIPAKLCVGLVYTRGRFFYHAWNEAYLGRWMTIDATVNQMPADVTHIKLLEGNLDKQVELTKIIGVLNIKVLDYEYD